jgi:hypothetical protein
MLYERPGEWWGLGIWLLWTSTTPSPVWAPGAVPSSYCVFSLAFGRLLTQALISARLNVPGDPVWWSSSSFHVTLSCLYSDLRVGQSAMSLVLRESSLVSAPWRDLGSKLGSCRLASLCPVSQGSLTFSSSCPVSRNSSNLTRSGGLQKPTFQTFPFFLERRVSDILKMWIKRKVKTAFLFT